MYRESKPEARLARWVECTWTLASETAVHGYPVRPDGCVDLIYVPGNGVQVVGTMTTERRFDLAAGARTSGIRFRPGMAGAFVRVAAGDLTDRTVELRDVWGSAAREAEERIAGGEGFERVLQAPDGAPGGVQRAIETIAAAHGDIDLDWVAAQAGLSARQFRRRCEEESGLSPKHLCRVLRFRRAIELAGTSGDWAQIAAAAGYFDQSHLIRDFREFTGGATPVSVFSKTAAAGAG